MNGLDNSLVIFWQIMANCRVEKALSCCRVFTGHMCTYVELNISQMKSRFNVEFGDKKIVFARLHVLLEIINHTIANNMLLFMCSTYNFYDCWRGR